MFPKARVAIFTILAVILFALGGSGVSAAQTGYVSSAPAASVPAAVTPLPVSAIAAGYEHTCVLVNGGIKCWGSNRYGQLGPISITIHPFPVDVNLSGISGTVTEITAGAYHTCALISGSVWCWGLNSRGQLGNGTTTNSPAPVQVLGLATIQHISAGYDYTCAMGASSMACWGDNTYGQLGNNAPSTSPVTTPVGVTGLTTPFQISAGFDHTCALLTDKTVQCWGRNRYGQLGIGAGNITDSPVPVPVTLAGLPSGNTVDAVAAGAQHTCLLTNAHTVYCWGDGSQGQMGNGKDNSVNTVPGIVNSLNTAASISAGGYSDTGHVCVVTTTFGVICWGSNVLGQIGDGTTTNRELPTAVSGLTNVSAVEVGVNHTCALLKDNTLQCWGSDSSGQLGDGVNTISPTPVSVSGTNAGATLLGTGEETSCAVINGKTMCWGNNRSGQVGDTTFTNRPAPTQVIGLSGAVTDIDGGMTQSCAIVNGGVTCWGTDLTGSVGMTSIINSGVSQFSVTYTHGCAVVNGAAMCWGDNSRGELGDGTTTNSPAAAVQVFGLNSGVQSVTTGQYFSCAVLTSGVAWCWGDNTYGQLGGGTNSPTPSLLPVQVQGLSTVTVAALAAGQDHTCALTTAGSMLCWGNNGQGQLGDGTQILRLAPTPVAGLTSGVTQITAGGYHTCALVNGGVKCWGFNSFGQIGNGQTTLSKLPVNVTGLTSGVLSVDAGGYYYDEEHTCALTSTHGIMCWGGDKYGQLGDNLQILHSTPVHVLGLADGPEIGQNYTNGNIGSYFRLAVANFPKNTTLKIFSNGAFLGPITSSDDGYAIFHVLVNNTALGPVQIQVTDGGSNTALTTLNIAAGAPIRLQEGSGTVYFASSNFNFLPAMFR